MAKAGAEAAAEVVREEAHMHGECDVQRSLEYDGAGRGRERERENSVVESTQKSSTQLTTFYKGASASGPASLTRSGPSCGRLATSLPSTYTHSPRGHPLYLPRPSRSKAMARLCPR